jgi:UDP-glucose 4-epimerase
MQPVPGKHVIVTGGAGFIGSHLVERLLRDGHRVVVIDDVSTGSWANLGAVEANQALTRISSRVSCCGTLGELCANASQIFHLAATVGVELVMTSGIETIRNNLDETQAILEAASVHRVPLLLTSTSEVYGKSAKAEFAEEDDLLIGPPNLHRWSYACSKLMDEFLALAYARERGLPVVIVRLFNTVGPRQTGKHGMVLPRFIEAARKGEPLKVFGDGSQSRCFCLVTDTVEALMRLVGTNAALGQVVNVGNPEEATILELARTVIASLGSPSEIEMIPYEKAYVAGFQDMQRRRPSVEKLHRVTGFRPKTSLKEIIRLAAA